MGPTNQMSEKKTQTIRYDRRDTRRVGKMVECGKTWKNKKSEREKNRKRKKEKSTPNSDNDMNCNDKRSGRLFRVSNMKSGQQFASPRFFSLYAPLKNAQPDRQRERERKREREGKETDACKLELSKMSQM